MATMRQLRATVAAGECPMCGADLVDGKCYNEGDDVNGMPITEDLLQQIARALGTNRLGRLPGTKFGRYKPR